MYWYRDAGGGVWPRRREDGFAAAVDADEVDASLRRLRGEDVDDRVVEVDSRPPEAADSVEEEVRECPRSCDSDEPDSRLRAAMLASVIADRKGVRIRAPFRES